MGIFGDFTIDQLKNILLPLDKTQLLTLYNNKLSNLTRRELLVLALKILDVDMSLWEEMKRIVNTGDARGQLLEVDEVRDILGNKIKSTKREYSYYGDDPKSPRDTITITEMDNLDQVVNVRKIKHYPDGRQPEWIE